MCHRPDDPAQTPRASGGCLAGGFRQFLRVQNTCPGGTQASPFNKPRGIDMRPPLKVQRIHFLGLFSIGLGDMRWRPCPLPLRQLPCPGAWPMCGPCSDLSGDSWAEGRAMWGRPAGPSRGGLMPSGPGGSYTFVWSFHTSAGAAEVHSHSDSAALFT